MKSEYSVSEVCKLCNVSRKQLVYYEERGLLHNVLRKENNYRYYNENNITELLAIKELRRIGFSLEEIYVMNTNDDVSSMINAVRKRVANAQELLEHSIHTLEQCNRRYEQFLNAVKLLEARKFSGDNGINDYEIVFFPGVYVISKRFKGNFFEVGEQINIWMEIDRIIDEYNIITLGSIISIYYNHFDSASCSFDYGIHDMEQCRAVTNMKRPCPYLKKIEPFKALATTHFGTFFDAELEKTYSGMFNYAKENGYKLANTSIEELLIGFSNTRNHKNWVTKIMIPIIE